MEGSQIRCKLYHKRETKTYVNLYDGNHQSSLIELPQDKPYEDPLLLKLHFLGPSQHVGNLLLLR